jgi:hypothetical protein
MAKIRMIFSCHTYIQHLTVKEQNRAQKATHCKLIYQMFQNEHNIYHVFKAHLQGVRSDI